MIPEEELLVDSCSRRITRTRSYQAALFQFVVVNSRKVLAAWLATVFQLAQIPVGLLQIARFMVCMLPNSNELIMIFFNDPEWRFF